MGISQAKPLISSFADDEDMRELIPQFVADLPRKVGNIQRLIAEGNGEGLRVLIHQLKGAGGGYGFDLITEVAAKAEAPLKEGQTIEQVKGEIDQLVELIRSVQGYIPAGETTPAANPISA